jgi:tetratricopeptide (TPR) repeat protein
MAQIGDPFFVLLEEAMPVSPKPQLHELVALPLKTVRGSIVSPAQAGKLPSATAPRYWNRSTRLLTALLLLLGTTSASSQGFLPDQEKPPKEQDKRRELVQSEVKLALKEATDFVERGQKLTDNTTALKGKGAIAGFRKALQLDPRTVQAYNTLGVMLYYLGDFNGAIRCFRKAIQLNPRDTRAYGNLGLALQARGNLNEAIASYRKALELDPKDARAYNHLGTALAAQGDLKGAIACYHKVLALDPKYVVGHFNLGNALKVQGDVKGAIACYKKTLDLDPKFARAHTNLGVALLQSGRLPEAQAAIKRALELLAPAEQTLARYNAARAAAGEADAGKLTDKEKSSLRQQALAWLRDNLKHYTGQLKGSDATQRAAVEKTLKNWQEDADLASVREAKALAKLPEGERAAWQQLWADVAALLKKVSAEP